MHFSGTEEKESAIASKGRDTARKSKQGERIPD